MLQLLDSLPDEEAHCLIKKLFQQARLYKEGKNVDEPY
jgi:hypothetical protein